MTASASLPMPRRREAATVAAGQAARPTARGAKPAAAKGEAERPSPRRSPAKTSGDGAGLATQLPALAFAAVVAAALIYGWQMRDEGHLTPESGVGYWLGIGGASTMLLLLGYPLRKRLTGLKIVGSVTGWFRDHMMLGVIGPALILLHANSKLGSLNSNVALLAMLTVASSGLIGRYLYGRIHLGLYGRRAQIAELQADVAAGGLPRRARPTRRARPQSAQRCAVVAFYLTAPALDVARPQGPARPGGRTTCRRRGQAPWMVVPPAASACEGRARTLLQQDLAAVNKTAAFVFYERLFGLWHLLHLPLFAILLFAAVIHVVAVHLY